MRTGARRSRRTAHRRALDGVPDRLARGPPAPCTSSSSPSGSTPRGSSSRRRCVREQDSFDYAVLRVVPHVEREEFINAGVILYCGRRDFLQARGRGSTRRGCSRCARTPTSRSHPAPRRHPRASARAARQRPHRSAAAARALALARRSAQHRAAGVARALRAVRRARRRARAHLQRDGDARALRRLSASAAEPAACPPASSPCR